MYVKLIAIFGLLGLFLLLCVIINCSAKHLNMNWEILTKKDLIAAHGTLQTQTMFAVDPYATHYQRWLEDGFKQAMESANHVKSKVGYRYVLRYYINGFYDTHIGIVLNFTKIAPPASSAKWPGFIVLYQNKQFIVQSKNTSSKTKNSIPPNGSYLIECDDKNPEQIMKENIFPYYGNPNIEASYVMLAQKIMIVDSSIFQKKFKACLFKYKKDKFRQNIIWKPMKKKDMAFVKKHQYRPPNRRFSIKDFGVGSAWVTVPTFSLKTRSQIGGYDKFLRGLSSLHDKKNIVIDLRGNDGGDTGLGVKILFTLYGQHANFLHKKSYKNDRYELWRVSKDNFHFLQSVALPLMRKEYGKKDSNYIATLALINEMQEALIKNKISIKIKNSEPNKFNISSSVKKGESWFNGQLYILTDWMCNSACLNFLDYTKQIRGVVQIGTPTNADTAYIDNRQIVLPSGFASLSLPMKVIRGRKRENNLPYNPEYRFNGDITDTKAVKQWVLGLISQTIQPSRI